MARTPMPVPRNRGGAAGPSIPPRGPESAWDRKLLIALGVALFIILLIFACTAIANASGPLQSTLPVIGAASTAIEAACTAIGAGHTGTYVTTTGALLGWECGMAAPEGRSHNPSQALVGEATRR